MGYAPRTAEQQLNNRITMLCHVVVLVFQVCKSYLAQKMGKSFQIGVTCPHPEVG